MTPPAGNWTRRKKARRRRQHVDQMQDRRPEPPPRAPAETDQSRRRPKDQRVGDDVVDGDGAAGDGEPERQESQHEARAAIRHRPGLDRHTRDMAEEEQKRQERDQGAVAVFGQLPSGQERRDPVPEDRPRREHGDRPARTDRAGRPRKRGPRRDGRSGSWSRRWPRMVKFHVNKCHTHKRMRHRGRERAAHRINPSVRLEARTTGGGSGISEDRRQASSQVVSRLAAAPGPGCRPPLPWRERRW